MRITPGSPHGATHIGTAPATERSRVSQNISPDIRMQTGTGMFSADDEK